MPWMELWWALPLLGYFGNDAPVRDGLRDEDFRTEGATAERESSYRRRDDGVMAMRSMSKSLLD